MGDKATKVNEDIEKFDRSKLKPTDTKDKNILPTCKDLEDEKKECQEHEHK